jgi:transposase
MISPSTESSATPPSGCSSGRAEHAFIGTYTIVKDYIREHRRRGREMFVPLHHPPGHAQADFGEASVVIGGVERTAHFFALY